MTATASTATSPAGLRLALEGCLGIPFVAGNRVDVLRNGVEAFPAMLEAIAAARRSIEFATFVYWRGEIAQRFAAALAERARHGVRVLVLLDAVGCAPMKRDLIETMREGGVQVKFFRPIVRWKFWRVTHRTHRKILVCDGAVGFTGGFGIAEEWEGDARNPDEWRDTHFRLRGPVVHGLQAAFCGNWLESGGGVGEAFSRIRPLESEGAVDVLALRATASPRWSDAATLMRVLIAGARRRLRIATAYFVPDQRAVELLCAAPGRGVEVDVLIPGPHADQRLSELAGGDEYGPLLEAGVRLHAFQPSMMHAKVITVDERFACVGSANFNQRSMCQDDEICLVIDAPEVTALLDAHFAQDLERAHEIRPGDWKRRGLLRRTKEMLADLVQPQV
jgi:cardiolipin synthase